jgi:hypothetical protein
MGSIVSRLVIAVHGDSGRSRRQGLEGGREMVFKFQMWFCFERMKKEDW